jgi:prevent-host-death family protein
MPTSLPTATISSSQLQQQIGTVLKRVALGGETITVTTRGFPIAVIEPIAEYTAHVGNREHPHLPPSRPIKKK